MEMLRSVYSVNDEIIIKIPLVDYSSANGDLLTAASQPHIDDIEIFYTNTSGTEIQAITTSGVTVSQSIASQPVYKIAIDFSTVFTNIDTRHPVIVTLIDQSDPKIYKDTAFMFVIPDQITLDVTTLSIVEQVAGGNTIIPVRVMPLDFYGNYTDPDDKEISIKAIDLSDDSDITDFYDEYALTTGATVSTTFTGYDKMKNNANGSTDYETFLKIPASPLLENPILLEIIYASNGITNKKRVMISMNNGHRLNSQGRADVDGAITNNTDINNIDTGVNNIEAKLPTNYIMGSADQGDYSDEIQNINNKVNIVDAKLPTNYIMGSSVQTDKDDEIDATKTRVELALPAIAPAANGGLGTVDANNRIVGIQGTKNTLDDLDDTSIADIKAMTVDNRTFEKHLEIQSARCANDFVKDEAAKKITYKTEDGASNSYVVTYSGTGRTKV